METGRTGPPREDRPRYSDSYRGNRDESSGDDDRGRGRSSYRSSRGGGGRSFFRKKVCRFCTQNLVADYKNPDGLRRFVTERGKILPRRITGTCAKHQRELSTQIKRARVLAFLPFSKN
ncbi:MAG: 30S ribosomal protein S18 [Spirochaetales bacterium]|nr:30S ribosomal protein S18 [Spirochaetales bacterium]